MSKIEQLSPSEPSELKEAISQVNFFKNPKPLVSKVYDGILGFNEAIFAGIDRDRVYAQKFTREPKGRGAHFDVYSDLIDAAHPAIGVYNLTGHATLRAFVLSRKLQEYYDETYPEPTDEAFEARREVSKLALAEAGITIMEARIKPAMGMVFPQFRGGRHLVHDIVPSQAEDTLSSFESNVGSSVGSFVKLVVPKDKATAMDDFRTRGYAPFSQFVEEQIAGVSRQDRDAAGGEPAAVTAAGRRKPKNSIVNPLLYNTEHGGGSAMEKPPCNLD